MKKILFFALALMLIAGTASAQNKNTNKKNKKMPPVSATSDKSTEGSALAPAMEKLPQAFMGLDAPLHQALKERRTTRDFLEDEIPIEMLSSLLWAAYGFNRPDEMKRTAPSAVNVQEFDIYVFTRERVYRYNAENQSLQIVTEGDHRAEISEQKHFAIAPISIVLVANYDRMTKFKKVEDRDFYAAVDAGYISQNIYLYCAAADLGTVACGGINRDAISKVLNIKNGRALLAHPIGRRQ